MYVVVLLCLVYSSNVYEDAPIPSLCKYCDLKLILQDWSEINPLYRRSTKKPKRSSFDPIDSDDHDEHGDIGRMAGDVANKDGGFSYNGDIGDVANRRGVIIRRSLYL